MPAGYREKQRFSQRRQLHHRHSKKELVVGCKNSVIPADGSVEIISEFAFRECASLVSLTIPEGVREIGKYAFWGCTGLANVTISKSVREIKSSAFEECAKLSVVRYSGTGEEWQKITVGDCNEPLLNAKIVFGFQS